MPKTKDNPQIHLQEAQAALQRLQTFALPSETRLALQETGRHLSKLDDYLKESLAQGHLAALNRVSSVLGTSLDVDAVLTQVMDAVIELTHAERGFLMLIDPDSGTLTLRAARNIERETLERKDMEISRTVVRTVVENGAGIVTTDAQNDPRFAGQASVIFYALRSILCAPLRVRGQVMGVIYVDNRAQLGIFTDDDLDLLNAFAAQAAIAIDNARLYTQTDQALTARVSELETLTHIDRDLTAQLDFERVLEIACRWAVEGTESTQSWIALFGEENPNLTLVAGPEQAFTLSLEDQVISACLKDCQALGLPAAPGQPARAIAPILHTAKPIGVLIVERPDAFSDAALRFLDRLAARAASAIQNARLYQAVQDANLAKSKFVSVVTHELRLPMTSIKGYADLLRQGAVGPVNEMQLNFVDVIRNNVERMSTLVSDLSDVSRIETGRLKLGMALISLQDYITEAVNSLKPKIDEKGQMLTLDIPADLPQVHADPNRVVQVMNNLLSNAHKYTHTGGKITVRAFVDQDRVRVEVRDTGIGISAEDQIQLFTQFFRSEDPEVREQQGWGLGLNVAKKLVELMEGEIGMQSVFREGSTFWFTLPISIKEPFTESQ
jgi:signal transduction histidine kinase